MLSYEVIIVGSGPAGLSCAINLYATGLKDIGIITISDNNYHKPCAGLLTQKSLDILQSMNIDAIEDLGYYNGHNKSYNNGYSYNFYYKDQKKLTFDSKDYFCYCSSQFNRHKLDDFLYNKVISCGIKIYTKTVITDIDFKNKIIYTHNQTFHYKNIVFADGTNGYSKKIQPRYKHQNISFEVIIKDSNHQQPFVDTFFGVTKMGYAWIGGSGEYINIGLTDRYDSKVNYRKVIQELAKQKGYTDDLTNIKGAFYPSKVKKLVLRKNIYFIGDAAGLADPFTSEGIYYALYSGKSVANAIKNNKSSLYIKDFKKIVKNLNVARRLFPLFYSSTFQKWFWHRKKLGNKSFSAYAIDKVMLTNKFYYFQLFRCYQEYKKRVL